MEELSQKRPVLVSACLLGMRTRHDGKDALNEDVMAALSEITAIPFCPEQSGGLPTPRDPSSIVSGCGLDVLDGRTRVESLQGIDVTENFIRGARQALSLALSSGAKEAYLKEKSPSCGVKFIYNKDTLIRGSGVTTAMLERAGIKTIGF